MLRERLQYDNQRATVQAELEDAQARLAGDAKPGKGNRKNKDDDG